MEQRGEGSIVRTPPPLPNLTSSLPREGREEVPSHLLLTVSYLYKISNESGLSHLGSSVCSGVVTDRTVIGRGTPFHSGAAT